MVLYGTTPTSFGTADRWLQSVMKKTYSDKSQAEEFLTEFMMRLNGQDNRSTATPYYFVVQSLDRVLDQDEWIWVNEEGGEIDSCDVSAEELEERGYDNFEDYAEGELDKYYSKLEYVDRQGPFLSLEAAENHIESNDYHYNEPRTYCKGAWRNPELELLLKSVGELINIPYRKR